MTASSRKHFKIVKLLLDKGAEVNHQNKVSQLNCSNHHVQSISVACTRWLVIYVLDVGVGTYLIWSSWTVFKPPPKRTIPIILTCTCTMYYRLVCHCDRDYIYI